MRCLLPALSKSSSKDCNGRYTDLLLNPYRFIISSNMTRSRHPLSPPSSPTPTVLRGIPLYKPARKSWLGDAGQNATPNGALNDTPRTFLELLGCVEPRFKGLSKSAQPVFFFFLSGYFDPWLQKASKNICMALYGTFKPYLWLSGDHLCIRCKKREEGRQTIEH